MTVKDRIKAKLEERYAQGMMKSICGEIDDAIRNADHETISEIFTELITTFQQTERYFRAGGMGAKAIKDVWRGLQQIRKTYVDTMTSWRDAEGRSQAV